MLLPWKFQRAPALFGGNRLISALFSAPEACYEERFNEPMCTPPSAFSALVLNPQPFFSANDLGSHGQFSEYASSIPCRFVSQKDGCLYRKRGGSHFSEDSI